jgi:hypothetical protein
MVAVKMIISFSSVSSYYLFVSDGYRVLGTLVLCRLQDGGCG